MGARVRKGRIVMGAVSRVTKPLSSEALYQIRTDDPFLTIENQDGRTQAVTGGKRLHYAWFQLGGCRVAVEAASPGFWGNGRGVGARP